MSTFAIDCMGGDHGTDVVFQAVKKVLDEFSDLKVNLFITDSVDVGSHFKNDARVKFYRSSSYISADLSIYDTLKNYKSTSMYMAIQSVAQNESDAVFTVGHTAPYFLLAKKILGTFDNLSRLPLAVVIPSANGGHKILTDIGANLECSGEDLYQFGLLGQNFAKALGKDDAKISLINVGHEATKGPLALRQAYSLFQNSKFKQNFEGFIDADKIFTCAADVIVTDGFSGNCISKACEGTSRFIIGKLTKYWIMRKLMSLFLDSADKYNGAILLGIRKLCIKAHGSSQVPSLVSALRTMYKFSQKYNYLKQSLCETDFSIPSNK
ncbi:MAG: hypothetical protein H6845_00065 [Alphaproteobacteria bacterium]|nr:MAG: hypothetical protein H6845_00065 [Alphaproteobacteria bacterium]